MPLRILHTFRTIDPEAGGPVENVCQLLAVNRRLGHTVELLTLDAPDAPRLGRWGFPVHAVGPARGAQGYSPQYVPWLREHCAQYDCVVIHGLWEFNAIGTRRALRGTGVPYFVFLHGMLDPWFKARFPLRHWRHWLNWTWSGYPLLRDAHAVFFTSEEERRRARESFWLYDCHEFVLRYGATGVPAGLGEEVREEFLAAHPGLRGKRLFTCFGRLHPGDGSDMLIRAVQVMLKQGQWASESMRLVIAAPADGAYPDALRRIVDQAGVGEVVYWTGRLEDRAKWGALRAAEVCVRPSHHENFGIGIVEALSVGTPVLLAKGVLIWRDIMNDGAGLADHDTPNGCVRLLTHWIGLTDEARAAMRLRARRCFEERYTAQSAANVLTSAIYLLLGVHRYGRWDHKPLREELDFL
ncbi:MAG TPA: glycosyltransferase [Opitutaceae bacterium]|nr:glycosyltransferase [Opitutaceae bacterium]